MLDNRDSALYQGTFTSSAQTSSLQVESEPVQVTSVPFHKSTTFTAIVLAAVAAVVLTLIAICFGEARARRASSTWLAPC